MHTPAFTSGQNHRRVAEHLTDRKQLIDIKCKTAKRAAKCNSFQARTGHCGLECLLTGGKRTLNSVRQESADDPKRTFSRICGSACGYGKPGRKLENSSQVKNVSSDLIIGADGAFSAVRFAMQMTDRFNYSQQYIDHGYKELTIPASKNGEFQLEKNALHIWPRGNYMLIALPNQDASFTCTLFFPFEGDPSFSSLKNTNQVEEFFNTTFPDAVSLLESMPAEFFLNPTSSLVTVKCYPWVKDKVLLIGDAAHAIVPFYGQGMNAGFEDCRILNGLIEEFDKNWDEILPAYQENRKPDGDAISSLALKNFIEMRDLVGDSNFILRKKIEARLHESYPDKWIPLYSMVTFNEKMRYSEAESIGKVQEKIMDQVMMSSDIEKSWENLDFGKIVEKL